MKAIKENPPVLYPDAADKRLEWAFQAGEVTAKRLGPVKLYRHWETGNSGPHTPTDRLIPFSRCLGNYSFKAVRAKVGETKLSEEERELVKADAGKLKRPDSRPSALDHELARIASHPLRRRFGISESGNYKFKRGNLL